MSGFPPSIAAMKAEAKELKKLSGGKHQSCLETVARSYGFVNFNKAIEFYKGKV